MAIYHMVDGKVCFMEDLRSGRRYYFRKKLDRSSQPSQCSLFSKKHPTITGMLTHSIVRNGCILTSVIAGASLLPLIILYPFAWSHLIAIGIATLASLAFIVSERLSMETGETHTPSCK